MGARVGVAVATGAGVGAAVAVGARVTIGARVGPNVAVLTETEGVTSSVVGDNVLVGAETWVPRVVGSDVGAGVKEAPGGSRGGLPREPIAATTNTVAVPIAIRWRPDACCQPVLMNEMWFPPQRNGITSRYLRWATSLLTTSQGAIGTLMVRAQPAISRSSTAFSVASTARSQRTLTAIHMERYSQRTDTTGGSQVDGSWSDF